MKATKIREFYELLTDNLCLSWWLVNFHLFVWCCPLSQESIYFAPLHLCRCRPISLVIAWRFGL